MDTDTLADVLAAEWGDLPLDVARSVLRWSFSGAPCLEWRSSQSGTAKGPSRRRNETSYRDTCAWGAWLIWSRRRHGCRWRKQLRQRPKREANGEEIAMPGVSRGARDHADFDPQNMDLSPLFSRSPTSCQIRRHPSCKLVAIRGNSKKGNRDGQSLHLDRRGGPAIRAGQ